MPVVDGIDYTSQGGYNGLDFAALGGVYTTPATGAYIRLGKIGTRHVAVDIFGKVLTIRGVMRATRDDGAVLGGGQQSGRSLTSVISTKYAGGDVDSNWRNATGARLRNFHFNIVGNTSGSFNNGGGMLTFFDYQPMFSAMLRSRMQAKIPGNEPIKDLIHATNFASGSGGRMFGDVFDSKYAAFVPLWVDPVWNDPKIFAFWADDGDHVSAFGGAGHPDEVGFTDPDTNYGFHAGMIALIGRPTITSQSNPNISFGGTETWTADTVNHTKAALISYLTTKYTTIAALNAAWGSTYTTFGSAGGWGTGTGLTDEAGIVAKAWMGSASAKTFPQNGGPNNLVNSRTWGLTGPLVASTYYPGIQVRAMANDLDHFAYLIFEKYHKPVRDRIKAVRPGALYAGMNGGQPGRAPGLKAINDYCDVVMGGGHYAFGGSHELNPVAVAQTNFERTILTIPTFTSYYTGIVGDTCLYYLSPGSTETQAENGGDYQACLEAAMNYQAPNGDYPYIGGLKWGLYDQIGEGVGWGLFSLNDNPYDGSDRRVAGPDPYNAITGQSRTTFAEDRVYGNQLGPVTLANRNVFTIIQNQFAGETPDPDVTPPTQPGAIAFTPSPSSVILQWGASTDPGSPASGIKDYQISRRLTAVGGAYTLIATVTGTTVVDTTNIVAETGYDYSIVARDNAFPTPNSSTARTGSTTTTAAPVGTVAVTENFNRGSVSSTQAAFQLASTPITSGWGNDSAQASLIVASGGTAEERFDQLTDTDDQVAEFDLTGFTPGSGGFVTAGVTLRRSGSVDTKYLVRLIISPAEAAVGEFRVNRVVAGSFSENSVLSVAGITVGKRYRVEISGDATVTIRVYQDGTLVGTYTDSAAERITTGKLVSLWGTSFGTGAVFKLDNLAFGDLNTTPVDPDDPVVVITSPADLATVEGAISIDALVTDLSGSGIAATRLFIDDAQVFGSPPFAATATVFPIDTTTLTDAAHEVYVEVEDNLGNVGTSATITITVDNPAAVTTRKLQVSWVEFEVPNAPAAESGTASILIGWDRVAGADAYQITQDGVVTAVVPQVAVGIQPTHLATVTTGARVKHEIRSFFGATLSDPLVQIDRYLQDAPTGFQVLSKEFTP